MFKVFHFICVWLILTSLSFTAYAESLSELDELLAKNQGNVVYIDFWASWCGPCRQSFPWMNDLQQQYQDQGLTIISINLDASRVFADEFLHETPASFPIIYDPKGKIAKKFEVKGMPSSYLINRQGERVSAHVGFNETKKVAYQEEIIQLLKKEQID